MTSSGPEPHNEASKPPQQTNSHAPDDPYPKIPAELKLRHQWVCWKLDTDTDKKIPINPSNGRYADDTDPGDWGSYEEALAHDPKHIGFVFSKDDPYTGIDYDDCRDAKLGMPEAWALEIIDRLNSYTEYSPSGDGYHTIVKAALRKNQPQKPCELYDHSRYFTFTGKQLTSFSSNIEERELTWLEDRLEARKQKDEKGGRSNSLISYVGTLANKHLAAAEIKILVRAANQKFAEPLSERELEQTIDKSITRYAKGAEVDLIDPESWRDGCYSLDQLPTDEPRYLVEKLIPEGCLTAVTGHSFNGKTWFTMQLGHAASEGKDVWGFRVPEQVPVIYHVPEMSAPQVRLYMRILGIPNSERFLVRPMDQGVWALDDPRMLKSSEGRLVVLDTQGWFNQAKDGNDYQQAVQFASLSFSLLKAGARAVVTLFHQPKNSKEEWTLQNSLMGSAGYGAMIRSCLRLANLNPDLNDPGMQLYVQGMKNPGLKQFKLEGPPPLKLTAAPGECPYLKGMQAEVEDARYKEACTLFLQKVSQRQVAKQLKLSLGKVNQWYQKWTAEF